MTQNIFMAQAKTINAVEKKENTESNEESQSNLQIDPDKLSNDKNKNNKSKNGLKSKLNRVAKSIKIGFKNFWDDIKYFAFVKEQDNKTERELLESLTELNMWGQEIQSEERKARGDPDYHNPHDRQKKPMRAIKDRYLNAPLDEHGAPDFSALAVQAVENKEFENAYSLLNVAHKVNIEKYGAHHIESVKTLFSLLDVYVSLNDSLKKIKNKEISNYYDTCADFIERNTAEFTDVELEKYYTMMGAVQLYFNDMELATSQFEKAKTILLRLLSQSKSKQQQEEYKEEQNQPLKLKSDENSLTTKIQTQLFNTYNSIGMAQSQMRQFDAAMKSFTLARELQDSHFLRINTANCYESMGKPLDAIANYDMALLQLDSMPDKPIHLLDNEYFILNKLSQLCIQTKQFQKSNEHLHNALEVIKLQMKDEKEKVVEHLRIMEQLGNNFMVLRNHPAALHYYRQALVFGEHVHGVGSPQTANILNQIGLACTTKEDVTVGLHHFLKAREIMEQYEPSSEQLSFVYMNLVAIYIEIREYQQAKEVCEKAYDLRLTLFGADHELTQQSAKFLNMLRQKIGQQVQSEQMDIKHEESQQQWYEK